MTTNLRIAPLFTALTTLSANANWPATLKGLLQGQMVNDAGKLVVIEELMYAIVEGKWQNNSAVYFPFYHDNIPIFFLSYLKIEYYVSRAERKFQTIWKFVLEELLLHPHSSEKVGS